MPEILGKLSRIDYDREGENRVKVC